MGGKKDNSVAAGEHYNDTAYATLDFEIVDEAIRAGAYSDTLTFTVNVAEAVTPGATFGDGTPLTWEELQLEENGTKYGYKASAISDTSIGNYAFAHCESITSITIPDGVTSIDTCAFHSCTSIASVTIPDSLTVINARAFACCESLTNINYAGSTSDWDNITLDDAWNEGVPATYVQCSDGTVSIENT